MSIGLSSGKNTDELTALAAHLDRLYDTPLTNALVEMVREITTENKRLIAEIATVNHAAMRRVR